jgi:segregation and condensation protein B
MKKREHHDETPTPTVTAADNDDDTQVGPAPEAPAEDDDEWDGPTREVAAEEVAALAIKSTSEMEAVVLPADADPGAAAESADAPPVVEEGASAEVPADGEGTGAPDPGAAPGRLENVIESLLFVSDRPLTIPELKRLTGERQAAKLNAAIESLRDRRQDSGIQVVPVAGGWHLRTHAGNAAWVSRLISGRPQRLSRAMLETLAIVAYRQPVTRPEIDEIRGVDCGPVLGTLLDRGLVRMIGKKEEVGRPILYGTTPEFLRTFSLRDLNELPTLREFHELSEQHQDEVARADAEAGRLPEGDGAGDGEPTAVQPAAEARPRTPLRELDPEEDDELLSELERATSAAAKATNVAEPGTEPATEVVPADVPPPPAPGPTDEPVGGAD